MSPRRAQASEEDTRPNATLSYLEVLKDMRGFHPDGSGTPPTVNGGKRWRNSTHNTLDPGLQVR